MKKRPTIVYETIDENGVSTRKPVVVMRDYDEPFTPQEGIETKIGNLGHMVKCNFAFEHKACYLSKLQSGNPYDLVKIGNGVARSYQTAEKSANYNKDEK